MTTRHDCYQTVTIEARDGDITTAHRFKNDHQDDIDTHSITTITTTNSRQNVQNMEHQVFLRPHLRLQTQHVSWHLHYSSEATQTAKGRLR